MKVLVIQQKMIGDVLLSSILFEALNDKFPGAELHFLIRKNTLPVVAGNPYIHTIILDREDALGKKLNFIAFLSRLRKERYYAVIDVYSKIGSALLTYGTYAKVRVGRKKWYTWFLYTATRDYQNTPKSIVGKAIQFRMDLLRPLGIAGEQTYRPKISLSPEEKEVAKKFMVQSGVNLSRPIVMCSVLGSSMNKSYPLAHFAEVLKTIVATCDVQLLFNYLPSQHDRVEELLSLCDPKVKSRVIRSCYATSLRQFISIASFCDVLIGNEGGAVHMAKAVDVPTFAIFSPQIQKETWINEESDKDVAVHINDYKPELFDNLTEKKDVLAANERLYTAFSPAHFEPLLVDFLKKNINK